MSDIIALPVQQAKSRVLITLVLDTSLSMAHTGGINQLNAALHQFRDGLQSNDFLMRTGELAVVTFGLGHVRIIDPSGRSTGPVEQPFVPLRQFQPPTLEAGGATPMVDGIKAAFSMVQSRKSQIRNEGLMLAHRPFVFVITDGQPTDDRGQITDAWQEFVPVIRDLERNKHLLFIPIGVDGADQDVLRGLGPKSYKMLNDVDFGAAMTLVSASIEALTGARRSGNDTADAMYDDLNAELSKQERIMAFLQGSA